MLVTTYLIVMLVSIFSLAFFSRSNTFLQASERNQNKIIAFNMAEAAVDFAIAQLAANPSYTGTSGYVSMDTASARGGFIATVSTPPDNPMIRMIQANGFSPDNVTTSHRLS